MPRTPSPWTRCWLLILALAGVLSGAAAFAAEETTGTVKLAWDLSNEPDIAGYRVHYGPESGRYTETVDVGYQARAQLNDLPVGSTHFCAVTAYNTYGLESDYSNEISFTVKPPPEARDSDGDGLSDLYESTYGNGLDLEPMADPDRDGIITLAEFVHGMDPTQPNEHPLAKLGPVLVDGVPHLGLSYLVDPLADRFVTTHLERSTDCSDPDGWVRTQTTVVSASVPAEHPDLIEIVVYSLSPISAQPSEFLRFGYEMTTP